jgi:hypothetical protein
MTSGRYRQAKVLQKFSPLLGQESYEEAISTPLKRATLAYQEVTTSTRLIFGGAFWGIWIFLLQHAFRFFMRPFWRLGVSV